MVKKGVVFLLILFSFAVSAKVKQSEDILKLLEKIKQSYSSINSFEADFKQVRKSPLLKDAAVTYGKFYFKKPDKLRLKFLKPYSISIFYKKNRVYRFDYDTGKYAVLNIKRHRENALNFLNVGKTFDFLTKYFVIRNVETRGKDIYLIFIPKKRRVKKRFKIVEMWLDSETYLFKKIYVEQKDGTDTTVMLSNVKINLPIKDSVFEFSKKGFKKEKWQ